jgi:hypothetical protein
VRAQRPDIHIEAHGRVVGKRALPGVDIEPVYGRQAVRAKRLRAVEDIRVAVVVRVQDGTVPAPPPRVSHILLIGLVGERAAGLLDVQRICFHRGAAIGPDAAEHVFQAVGAEISGLAVVPVLDLREVGGIGLAERAVTIVEPQIRWVPMARHKYVRPAIGAEIGNGRAEGPVLRAADARGRRLVGDGRVRGDGLDDLLVVRPAVPDGGVDQCRAGLIGTIFLR